MTIKKGSAIDIDSFAKKTFDSLTNQAINNNTMASGPLVEESVYSLIQQTSAGVEKPAMYRSKHGGGVIPPTASTFGLHGTSKIRANVSGNDHTGDRQVHPSVKNVGSFGRSVTGTINPKNFLKKTEHQDCASQQGGFSRPLTLPLKNSVPTRSDKPVMGLKSDKNFVVSNAVETILSAPAKNAAGEQAIYRKTYGQVPAYLNKIKTELKSQAMDKAALNSSLPSSQAASGVAELQEDEVHELRAGLQRRWDALNKQFQTLSFTLETLSQLGKKERLEKEMKAVEDSLKKLGKKRIVVQDD